MAGIRDSDRDVSWTRAAPRSVALRILAQMVGGDVPPDHEATGPPVFELADFQEAAVRRARRILESRRGVFLADSVGLGKTYIALALIEQALRRGERVLVVTPAALRRDWIAALRRLRDAIGVPATLGLGGATGGHGILRSDTMLRDSPGAFLGWLSHTRLSRGTYPTAPLQALDLIIVDEAHAFRSPRTRRYRALAELCRPARVVLISATPINNSLWDLYFQIRLFAGDGAFRDVGVPDLAHAVRSAAATRAGATGAAATTAGTTRGRATGAGTTAAGATRARATGAGTTAAGATETDMAEGDATRAALAPILGEIMIRRTRALLRARADIRLPGSYPAVRSTFPGCVLPLPIRYSLEDTYPGFFDALADLLEELTMAPFRLAAYGAPTPLSGAGCAELLRLGLLKRLESSLAAFRLSIDRLYRYLEAFLGSLEAGRLRMPADHRALDRGGDLLQTVLEEVAFSPAPPTLDAPRLREDAVADLHRLRRLRARLSTVAAAGDPKLGRLERLLEQEVRGEKALIFTEFRETARFLWRTLLPRGGIALVDGEGAWLGAARAGRADVISRFAPTANGRTAPPRRERVDLLIATDVLAEGLNLQDAGRIVSYDLPWNPVRLIQRIGRVDRIGSPFEVIHAYYFLPDRGLDRLLRIVGRLQAKLATIRDAVGSESTGLEASGGDVGPPPGFVERLAAGDPGLLDEAPPTPMERLRAAYRKALADAPPDLSGDRNDRRDRRESGDPDAVETPLDSGGVENPAKPASVERPPGRGDVENRRKTSQRRENEPLAGVVALPPGTPHRVLVAARYRERIIPVIFGAHDRSAHVNDTEAADILLYALNALSDLELAPDASVLAHAIAAAVPAIERHAMDPGLESLPPHSPEARAARLLLRMLARVPGGADPAACRRADAVLTRLSRRHGAGTSARLATMVPAFRGVSPEPRSIDRLLDSLEETLPPIDGPAAAGRPGAPPDPPRLLGLLELRPRA